MINRSKRSAVLLMLSLIYWSSRLLPKVSSSPLVLKVMSLKLWELI